MKEELYYPSSENKGADQLRSNCEADLRLCFRICKNPIFSDVAQFLIKNRIHQFYYMKVGYKGIYISWACYTDGLT